MNEASLLAAAKGGETRALGTLYEAHAAKLFRTLCRLTRNRQDAEDTVQDSFLRVLLHLKGFDGRSAFSTWLTRIGINSALMLLRKKRNSREVAPTNDGESESPWEAMDSAPDAGLWADGSCFSKLIVPLQAEGYECIAAQYGLNSTAEDVALTKATIGRVSSPVILAKVGGTAWKSKPSWYIVGKKDRTVHPDLERFFAKRMGATTYESSHVPMLSQPNSVVDVIRAAAKAVQGAAAAA